MSGIDEPTRPAPLPAECHDDETGYTSHLTFCRLCSRQFPADSMPRPNVCEACWDAYENPDPVPMDRRCPTCSVALETDLNESDRRTETYCPECQRPFEENP